MQKIIIVVDMAAKKPVKKPRTFVQKKKPVTSATKEIKKELVKQEKMLEEIKTLIEHEPRPVETVSMESTSISTTKEIDSGVKESAKTPAEVKIKEEVKELKVETVAETEPTKESSPEKDSEVDTKETAAKEDVVDASPVNGGGNSEEATNKKRMWINLIIIFIGTVVIVSFFLFLRQKKIDEMNLQEQSSKVVPTKAVTPSPTPEEVDVSAYTIEVLNGSGISGAAAKAKTLLTEESFTVESTGNADASDYEKTVIKAKGSVPEAYIEALKQLLAESYELDSVEDLAESADTDVVIIIGSQKPE